MGQNLKAKNYTYFGMERVSYTTYSLNSTKPSKKKPNMQKNCSLCLFACSSPRAPVPRLYVFSNAPPALGPPPVPQTGVTVRLPPPSLPISATATPAWQAAGASPSQRQRPSTSMKEAGTIYYYGFVMAVIT
jgi:hypothetical protein